MSAQAQIAESRQWRRNVWRGWLTVDHLVGVFGGEPELVRADADDRAILLVQSPAQVKHATISYLVGVPARGDCGERWPWRSRERMQAKPVGCDGRE